MEQSNQREHPEVVKKELVYPGSIIDVYKEDVLLPNGNHEVWDLVEHRKGAACILPVTGENKILLVRQYRPALSRYTLEVPAGCREETESMEQCAAREMEEETGFIAKKIQFLLSLRTTVAFCNERVDVFLGTELLQGKKHLDAGEAITLEEWNMEDLLEKVFNGEIQDAKTVAAILACHNKLF